MTDVTVPEYKHLTVLLDEAVDALDLAGARADGIYIDGTFGRGGHSRLILSRLGEKGRLIGFDKDLQAIATAATIADPRFTIVHDSFATMQEALAERGLTQVDGILLDLGISSPQVDDAARGFSFRNDGPLDMRMERAGPSAADLVNEYEEADLADIIYHYGEERRSRAVARAIIEARRKGRIETTGALAEIVASVVWADPASGINPATRTFQGLRIAVNDELGELVQALHAAERILKPGGRLAVVTFHSLEDRIVKQFFSARSGRAAQASRHVPSLEAPAPRSFTAITKGPVLPSDAETARNPRARSAKLRAVERTGAPAPEPLAAIETLAALPVRTGRSGGARR